MEVVSLLENEEFCLFCTMTVAAVQSIWPSERNTDKSIHCVVEMPNFISIISTCNIFDCTKYFCVRTKYYLTVPTQTCVGTMWKNCRSTKIDAIISSVWDCWNARTGRQVAMKFVCERKVSSWWESWSSVGQNAVSKHTLSKFISCRPDKVSGNGVSYFTVPALLQGSGDDAGSVKWGF